MIDWKGLYNWVNTKTGTESKFDKTIPPLNKDQIDFLEKAMKEYTIDECKRMKEIVDYLYNNAFTISKDKYDVIEANFEELLDLLTGIDNAMNLCKLGGNNILIALFFESNEKMVKENCSLILMEMSRNNPFVQNHNWSLIKDKLTQNLQNLDDEYFLYNIGILFSISSGICLNIKRDILNNNLHEILFESLCSKINDKSKKKLFQFFIDFLENEEYLELSEETLNNDIVQDKSKYEVKYPKFNKIMTNLAKNKLYIIENLTNDLLKNYKAKTHYYLEFLIRLVVKINENFIKNNIKIEMFEKIKKNLNLLKKDKSEDFKEIFNLIKF